MSLPQELIEEIVHYLGSDLRSLRNCSLVAKSWIRPSRRWLFSAVFISRKNHCSWLERIPPEDVELLDNVRTFSYVFDSSTLWHIVGRPSYRIDSLCHYLPSLRRLEFLQLYSMVLGPDVPQQIGLFSAFQHSLSSLSLTSCRVTSGALITLINYFPLLTYLGLRCLTYEANDEPTPQLSRALRGKLGIAGCRTQDVALFGALSNPPPELNELDLRDVHPATFYNAIVDAHGGSVKRLKISGYAGRNRPFPTLSRFSELRELEVPVLPRATQDELSLIASITSTNLRKIVLVARYGFGARGSSIFKGYHERLDSCLCRVVDQLRGFGYNHRLDVVLLIEDVPRGEDTGFGEFLPRFREQGRVKVVLEPGERVVCCSE